MDAITVELQHPIAILSNFDALQAQLGQELEKYAITVTEETLPGAKKAVAELRDLQKKIDRARIDYSRQFSEPINAWGENAKALVRMAKEAEEKIVVQVKTFEDRTRALCADLMAAYLEKAYEGLGVRPEFRVGRHMIPELVGLSKVTGAGALTKAARESIEGLAQQGRIAQDRVDGRLATLEAECLKAGLSQPMTPESVTHLLALDDVGYRAGLERMIRAEIDREARARQAIIDAEQARIRAEERAKAEAEARAKQAEEKARQDALNREAKARWEAAKAEEEKEKARQEPIPPAMAPHLPAMSHPIPVPPVHPPMKANVYPPEKALVVVVLRFTVPAMLPINGERIITWFREKVE